MIQFHEDLLLGLMEASLFVVDKSGIVIRIFSGSAKWKINGRSSRLKLV